MTNKNKNIKSLVKRSTADPDTQFEIIPTLTERVKPNDLGVESAENTSDLEQQDDSQSDQPVAVLQDLIEEQSRRVQELEYQLEHALSRRRGLQMELEVREEITESVNEDIRKARAQLSIAANELESLHRKYQALQKAHTETDVLARELGEQVARHQSDSAAKDRAIGDLQKQLDSTRAELQDMRAYVDGRRDNWASQEQNLADLNRALEDISARREELSSSLTAKEAELREAVRQLEITNSEADRQRHSIDRLGEENRELRDLLGGDSGQEISRFRDKLAAQAGELAARAQALDSLRKDNDRLEGYANSLRMRLQDQENASRDSVVASSKLEGSLDAATSKINELTDKLDRARTEIEALSDEKSRLKSEFEREVRQVRFELDNAQATIADQESINQQLTSDLIDNRGFRQALESHLGDVEQDSKNEIQSLRKQLEDAREAAANFERRIRIKDGAISDLTKALAEQKGSMEISHDLENALRKVDGFRQEEKRVRRKGERDYRVARMLVGEADGKELRFPLFKDRLTIGRTPHNDIQLNMRFISRRHAVIATDNNKTRIIDWGSRNGIYVNKKRVTEKILQSGDVITIGLTHLRFQERSKP